MVNLSRHCGGTIICTISSPLSIAMLWLIDLYKIKTYSVSYIQETVPSCTLLSCTKLGEAIGNVSMPF